MSDNKETRKKVASLLETALTGWKEELGEKKFAKRIEKAAKLFTEGMHDEKAQKTEKPKKEKAAPAEKAPKAEKAVNAPKAKAKVTAKPKVAKKAAAKKKAKPAAR
ncbi:hypothetical protein MKQ70_05105 [Chitinophaga sedimenti]|uniref:hypothetical protein n=1 Tax=Chitinophaga sedimenti TaxID=2033606 RepID=UPI002004CC5C|nr:hypothetical protein [Chitinophaga sedimenti]MCK7554414.1 hypothetical protein [Chitinophaga sedimenti]